MYSILLHECTFETIKKYKEQLAKKEKSPGSYLKAQITTLQLETVSILDFLNSLLATKKPTIFAESELTTGTWTNIELEILGNISVAVPVTVYDNGIWAPSDPAFRVHPEPFEAEFVFTPGALLSKPGCFRGDTPDFEKVVRGNQIDQAKFNELMERRLLPVFKHINEQAERAVITIPGIGCGQFAGKFQRRVGEHLNVALKHLLLQNRYSNIQCVYYSPYDECKKESHVSGNLKYRVRPVSQGGLPQLCHPKDYEEDGDDFANCKLFKVVAWDHLSYPGNDYFRGSRNTDDGVSAAATSSMETITVVRGRYEKGYYLPPAGYVSWKQVVRDKRVQLRADGSVKVVASDGAGSIYVS